MSNKEFTYWQAYYSRKMEIEKEANKPQKSEGRATAEFKKTMGNRQQPM